MKARVSVIGLSDKHWEEVVKAVIVLKKGDSTTESEIIGFPGERLAGFKKPKSVDFWEEFPKAKQEKY